MQCGVPIEGRLAGFRTERNNERSEMVIALHHYLRLREAIGQRLEGVDVRARKQLSCGNRKSTDIRADVEHRLHAETNQPLAVEVLIQTENDTLFPPHQEVGGKD